MRKIVASTAVAVAAALTLVACRTAPPIGGTGAPSAPAAVTDFLGAAHAGDVSRMASLFGTTGGSIARRDQPNDVEKRMRALQCYLTHDTARVLDDRPGTGAGRELTVELKQGNVVRRTTFSAVRGPHERWFVESFDISKTTDLCHP